MPNEIISYLEMCQREGVSLQRGMNYGIGKTYSVILMSVRPNAPYADRFEENGTTLIYEGHDVPISPQCPEPKSLDQPEQRTSGSLTDNGKFHRAAQEFKSGGRLPDRVKVYEKIKKGIWSYNGVFHLLDSWQEPSGNRQVFKFRLVAVEGEETDDAPVRIEAKVRRIIPTKVKLEVWKRDDGKCVMCGASDDLHFDHLIPYSLGGSSDTAENVQLLCASHNLEKRDRIE